MKHVYRDKHGEVIKEGMTIRHINGSTEKVIACIDADGDQNLGVNATNMNSPMFEMFTPVAYPLSEFDISREWEIVKE